VCGTRVDETAERHPKQVPCPDCFTMVTIPSLAEVQRNQPAEAAGPPDPGIYRLVLQPAEGDANGAKPPPRKREFLVVCPICRARLHVEPRSEPGQIRCPDCLEFVRVPSLAQVEEHEAKHATPKPAAQAVPALPVPAPFKQRRLRTSFDRAGAAIRREKTDPPPRFVFFSNVFSFPWSAGVVSRWVYLTVGMMALGLVYAGILTIMRGSGGFLLLGIAFFALPGIWIFVWTYSYATSIWITVLEDTAGGNNRIHNWLQQNWREWVIEASRFTLILGYAMTVAHCAGYAGQLAGGDYTEVAFDTLLIVFPIMMMSCLHAGSVFVPLTLPILRSLLTCWWAWLLYYILSSLVLLGVGVIWWEGITRYPIPVAILGGPAWAAAWLIWARLLGRLGYAISMKEQGLPATSRKRRQKPAEE
jgi:hypothetical protein